MALNTASDSPEMITATMGMNTSWAPPVMYGGVGRHPFDPVHQLIVHLSAETLHRTERLIDVGVLADFSGQKDRRGAGDDHHDGHERAERSRPGNDRRVRGARREEHTKRASDQPFGRNGRD